MGIKRIVDTAFWTDGKVDEFTPEDKYFMLYLLTNPFTTLLGIYEISVKQVAFQLGYSIEAVNVLLERFESKYKIIVYSKETNEVAIKNFLRHSIIKGGAPVRDCLVKELKAVKNKDLILQVFRHIKSCEELNATVRNIVDEYEEKNGELRYGNGVSYHDSSTIRKRIVKNGDNPVRHKYGEYKNVLLSDEDMEKLKNEFPVDYMERIERLSGYIASTGKSYKNHLATIRNWARKENGKGVAQNEVNARTDADDKFKDWQPQGLNI